MFLHAELSPTYGSRRGYDRQRRIGEKDERPCRGEIRWYEATDDGLLMDFRGRVDLWQFGWARRYQHFVCQNAVQGPYRQIYLLVDHDPRQECRG